MGFARLDLFFRGGIPTSLPQQSKPRQIYNGRILELVCADPKQANRLIASQGGIFTDITDRKRGEEKLKESEQLFRSIFENAYMPTSLYRATNLLTSSWASELGDGNRV